MIYNLTDASITNSEETELLKGVNSLTADGKNTLMAMLKSLRVIHSAAVKKKPFVSEGYFL